jgi:hypothetical protein
MIGECWHEWMPKASFFDSNTMKCNKCRTIGFLQYTDFSTPEGFFKLWNFCKEQEWWVKFHDFNGGRIIQYENELIPDIEIYINPYLINPNTFANAVAKFRGWKEEQ